MPRVPGWFNWQTDVAVVSMSADLELISFAPTRIGAFPAFTVDPLHWHEMKPYVDAVLQVISSAQS